jgi:ATP-dependent Lhr-like helicase
LHDGLLQLGFLSRGEYTSGGSSSGAAGDSATWDKWFRALTQDMRACCVRVEDSSWWVATERLAEFRALHPASEVQPDPSAVFSQNGTPDPQQALVELLRSRLSGLGPVEISTLAQDFPLEKGEIELALTALQTEGYAIRMNPPSKGSKARKTNSYKENWCERRLLARIHRYSREHRRKTARPVPPAAFMRFLLDWHGLGEPAGELEQVLALLEGWAAPVAAWEVGLLGSRCADYSPQRLDEQFLSGFVTWFRPPGSARNKQQLVAATPIAIVPRKHSGAWQGDSTEAAQAAEGISARLLQILEQRGAMFSDDLEQDSGLLRPQFEQAIAALVAQGLVTADAFSPLRWLIRPDAVKRKQEKALKRRKLDPNRAPGLLGRWSAIRNDLRSGRPDDMSGQALLAIQCEALLRRYGVVFRAVLERESLVQPWRHLLRYLRRMEDRGEVYGGRFVDGFSGEQFALPEAIGLLRRHAQQPDHRQLKVINATDPLNLGGFITAGVKTAALTGNRILLENGVPSARLVSGEIEMLKGGSVSASEAERYLRIVVGTRPAPPLQANTRL